MPIEFLTDIDYLDESKGVNQLDPTDQQDTATKDYVDSSSGGVFNGGIVFNSRYTTPVIGSDQDNYNIPDLDTYNLIDFRSSDDVEITGIDSSDLNNYYAYIFLNGNTNGKKIKFKKNDSGSSQANRFDMPDDIELEEGQLWWFVYSTDRNRWVAQAKL